MNIRGVHVIHRCSFRSEGAVGAAIRSSGALLDALSVMKFALQGLAYYPSGLRSREGKLREHRFWTPCRAKSGSWDVSSRDRSMCQCEALLASRLLSQHIIISALGKTSVAQSKVGTSSKGESTCWSAFDTTRHDGDFTSAMEL